MCYSNLWQLMCYQSANVGPTAKNSSCKLLSHTSCHMAYIHVLCFYSSHTQRQALQELGNKVHPTSGMKLHTHTHTTHFMVTVRVCDVLHYTAGDAASEGGSDYSSSNESEKSETVIIKPLKSLSASSNVSVHTYFHNIYTWTRN